MNRPCQTKPESASPGARSEDRRVGAGRRGSTAGCAKSCRL